MDSGASAPMSDADAELDALLARADAELAGTGVGDSAPMVRGEVDESAQNRRTQSILRRRGSEEELAGEPAMVPPSRFVRRSRPDTAGTEEPERRTLIVSTLFPSFRTPSGGREVRTVRWARKRKPEVSWDDVARPAYSGGARARELVGSVAYT